MLKKEAIKKGIQEGIVQFIVDPNMESGTVCKIGEYWFYFGGMTAEDESPDEYLAHVPIDDIVDEVYDAIDRLDEEESLYYEEFLNESLVRIELDRIKAEAQKRKKYLVTVDSFLARSFVVEADTAEEASEIVENKLNNGTIRLSMEDVEQTDIKVIYTPTEEELAKYPKI